MRRTGANTTLNLGWSQAKGGNRRPKGRPFTQLNCSFTGMVGKPGVTSWATHWLLMFATVRRLALKTVQERICWYSRDLVAAQHQSILRLPPVRLIFKSPGMKHKRKYNYSFLGGLWRATTFWIIVVIILAIVLFILFQLPLR